MVLVAVLPPLIFGANPMPAPAPVVPIARQVTVINPGPATIVRLSASPLQSAPSPISQLNQPLYPGVTQSIAIPAAPQCCYEIRAVYSDGHAVTIPVWDISNIQTITIPH